MRSQLQPYDDTGGRHTNRVDEHPELGRIDYVHIPLFVLREYFAKEYEKVKRYTTYAVVRDPFARFPSSLSQHLRMYGEWPIQEMKPHEVRKCIYNILNLLQDHKQSQSYLPYQYIHFQRQTDFIYDEGERLVDGLYTTEGIDVLISDISSRLGTNLSLEDSTEVDRANQTQVYRNSFLRGFVEPARKRLISLMKPILKPLLPQEKRKALSRASREWMLSNSNKQLKAIFSADDVREFIQDYYREDIRLYEDVRNLTYSLDA